MRPGAALLVVGVLALAGCSFQANLVVPASEVEQLAASALLEQWGGEPTLDCGEQNVDLVEGTLVQCTAHNPNSGLDYPATVTITEVEGTKYSIDVSVGQAAPQTPDAPTVAPDSVADLAAGALEPELGYRPVVDCGADPVPIVLDGTIDCVATGSDGADYPATITVTDVTETGYDIDVVMGAKPLS